MNSLDKVNVNNRYNRSYDRYIILPVIKISKISQESINQTEEF